MSGPRKTHLGLTWLLRTCTFHGLYVAFLPAPAAVPGTGKGHGSSLKSVQRPSKCLYANTVVWVVQTLATAPCISKVACQPECRSGSQSPGLCRAVCQLLREFLRVGRCRPFAFMDLDIYQLVDRYARERVSVVPCAHKRPVRQRVPPDAQLLRLPAGSLPGLSQAMCIQARYSTSGLVDRVQQA